MIKAVINFPFSSVICICVWIILAPYSSTLVLMLSAVIHELGHTAVMMICKNPPSEITIYPAGAEIRPYVMPKTAESIAVSLAGPAANTVTAVAAICADVFLKCGGIADTLCREAAAYGFSLAAFNMLPVNGLDGGYAVSAICSAIGNAPAQTFAKALSAVTYALLWLISVYAMLTLSGGESLYIICMYVFYDAMISDGIQYKK